MSAANLDRRLQLHKNLNKEKYALSVLDLRAFVMHGRGR